MKLKHWIEKQNEEALKPKAKAAPRKKADSQKKETTENKD